jgi:L-amino acid N-acyltransferase
MRTAFCAGNYLPSAQFLLQTACNIAQTAPQVCVRYHPMNIIACSYEAHAGAILEIFNDAILHSTALYEYKPRTMETMAVWFKTKAAGGFPVLGAVDTSGALLGFASYGTFRAFPAFKYSAEHSVYVHREQRGKGIGLALMQAIIAAARANDVHTLIGGIDAANSGSIALHEKLSFTHAGTIKQSGFKFGRWLDLAFYQLLLESPAKPVDG